MTEITDESSSSIEFCKISEGFVKLSTKNPFVSLFCIKKEPSWKELQLYWNL